MHHPVKPPVYIDASRVQEILKYEDLIPVIEEALVNYSARENGGVVQPLRTTVPVDDRGRLIVKPAYSAKDDTLAVKLVTAFPDNEKQGLPSIIATIVVFDPNNGLPQVIMDGDVITGMRTAAASAVATKYLATEDARVLCILGSGVQARSHVQALKLVRPFTEVKVWSRTLANAQKFADEIGARACATAEEASTDADVIVVATQGSRPVLFGKWVKPGALINSIGANRPTWRELDDEVVHNSFIVADSKPGVMEESGDVILPKAIVSGEIGDVISGNLSVPKGKTLVFKTLGMAVEDVVSAKLVLDKLQGNGNVAAPRLFGGKFGGVPKTQGTPETGVSGESVVSGVSGLGVPEFGGVSGSPGFLPFRASQGFRTTWAFPAFRAFRFFGLCRF